HAQSTKIWPAAVTKLAGGLTSGGSATRILIGSQVRGHRYALLAKLAKSLGAPAPMLVEPFGYEAVRAANAAVYGRPEIPTYDLANAELVVLFGEDLFSAGLSPAHYTWAYGNLRRGRERIRGQLVVVGTRFGQSAAIADLFIPVRPGTHGAIAQALLPAAHGGISAAMAADLTGAPEEKIVRLQSIYGGAKPSIAIGGGEVCGQSNAVTTLEAIAALNVASGSVGVKGGVLPPAPSPLSGLAPPAPASYGELARLRQEMASGAVRSLLLVGVDPFMAFPTAANLKAAMGKVPFIASFSTLPDDGAAMADVILPDTTFLERWGDSSPAVGVGASAAGLMQPVMDPFFDCRAVEDVVLDAAKQAGHDLGYPDAEAFYKAMWAPIAPDTQVPGAQSPWVRTLRVGGVFRAGNGPAYSS
ncbi:MAG: molybdopterin-dependent oxidoreductase, partial [Cyanobacteria bacterium REEB65]|nr:molybdopterin-dependent oxidoreductase [Cyanobacteria bacterium REEB65]